MYDDANFITISYSRPKLTMKNISNITLLHLVLLPKLFAFSPNFQSVIFTRDIGFSSFTELSSSRRRFFDTLSSSSLLLIPNVAAAIDPLLIKNLRIEGDESGAATRLAQIAAESGPRSSDADDVPFEKLSSGVSYREFREGKGEATVTRGSKVATEMTIRCKSFSTNTEPGGLKYFTTKGDTDFNEIAWTVGSGELPPGLEEGMMGMRKGGLRRIEVPTTMIYDAKKNGSLPLPSDKNKDGKRLFDRLFKTDATLLFEVLVTRVK